MKHKVLWLNILFASLILVVSACTDADDSPSDGDSPADGDTPVDGDTPDGDEPDGDAPVDGDAPDGDVPNPCDVDASQIDAAQTIQWSPENLDENADLFTLGVQAGSMEKDRAIVWSFSEDLENKTLRVWRAGAEEGEVALVVDRVVDAADGYLKTTVEGLAPNTEYWYAFFTGITEPFENRSIIGRFKTAFPDGCLAPVVMGGVHGTMVDFGKGVFPNLDIMANANLDMFLQLGDFSYSDGNGVYSTSLEEYRSRWEGTLTTAGYKDLLASTGEYLVIDDHEVADNGTWEGGLPQNLIDMGIDTWYEHAPVAEQDNGSYWRSFKWGDSVEVFALDCRTERQWETRESDDPIYIGKAQMEWLKQSLSDSSAHFKVVMNSVPIIGFGTVVIMQSDRWQGYAKQREEILDHITENDIENVWWITGDFHLGLVSRVEAEGPRSKMYELMVGPSPSYANPLYDLWELPGFDRENIGPNGMIEFLYGFPAATIMTFDPIADTVRVQFIEPANSTVIYDEELKWGEELPPMNMSR